MSSGVFKRSAKTLVSKKDKARPADLIDMDDELMEEAVKMVDSIGSGVQDTNLSSDNFVHSSPPKKKHAGYGNYLRKKAAGPSAPGSKPIPKGAPDCLNGLTIVFTGELTSIGRDEASDLVKSLGARVTGAPSRRTDYVVVGENAGESKLAKIQEFDLKTLDEDGLFNLILEKSKSSTPLTAHDEVSVKQSEIKPSVVKKSTVIIPHQSSSIGNDNQLWTVKYAPKSEEDLIGNHGIYEKLVSWLKDTNKEQKAALLSGPPGIGKTTMAHMAGKSCGFIVLEFNASDCRNKKTIHESVKEMTGNIALGAGFFTSTSSKEKASLTMKPQVLIMDEVDGMSSGDRGGMAELISIIKKSKIPIICCCNDRSSPKVRTLANYCLDLRLRRPDARQVSTRIRNICEQEGLELKPNVVEELVTSTHGDIRQVLNCLSTFKLNGDTEITYEQSKTIHAKDLEEGPFDSIAKLFSTQYCRMTIGQRLDAYFVDSSLVPLMVHENYQRSRPSGNQRTLSSKNPSTLQLVAEAADSLSLSDKVDSLIRGSNQEWSVAPLHGFMTAVLPCYFTHGSLSGQIAFPSWFGQNSKATKSQRLLREVSQHTFMSLKSTISDVRMIYCDYLTNSVLLPLLNGEVELAVDIMDRLHLCREDVDSLIELSSKQDYWTKIPTATKSAFTRKYNSTIHKLPYAVGAAVGKSVKVQDLDIGIEEEDGDVVAEDISEDADEEDSLLADKMIKEKKPKAVKRK